MFKKESISISQHNPLIIGKLEVYPDKLKYKDVRCNFSDIEHIDWYWLSQTINFLNTQNVRLGLHIRGLSKPIRIKKTTIYVTPKIVTAYNYIAQKTFQNRLQLYLNQLYNSGGFFYNNCNIYSDGRVVSNGKTFKLSKAETETFEITIKQGGVFSPKVKICLEQDRDVVLTLIDYILKNPQDPYVFVEIHKEQKKSKEKSTYFIRDMVSLMAIISGADGHVSPEEVNIVKDFLINTMDLSKEDFLYSVSIFNNLKDSPGSFEYYLKSILSYFKNDEDILVSILDILFDIAVADGVLNAEEELLLLQAETIFGVKGKSFLNFKNITNDTKIKNELYYLNIFGLSPKATQDEIRLEYRRLVLKFHPDRVHHLGEDYVKEAEIKMREINQAYDYLSRL